MESTRECADRCYNNSFHRREFTQLSWKRSKGACWKTLQETAVSNLRSRAKGSCEAFKQAATQCNVQKPSRPFLVPGSWAALRSISVECDISWKQCNLAIPVLGTASVSSGSACWSCMLSSITYRWSPRLVLSPPVSVFLPFLTLRPSRLWSLLIVLSFLYSFSSSSSYLAWAF